MGLSRLYRLCRFDRFVDACSDVAAASFARRPKSERRSDEDANRVLYEERPLVGAVRRSGSAWLRLDILHANRYTVTNTRSKIQFLTARYHHNYFGKTSRFRSAGYPRENWTRS